MTEATGTPTPQIESLARQTGFSADAVASMRRSLQRGGGRMAQFDHPEFGGPGQWMHGGMLMTADLFDHDLKRRVGQLCDTLAAWLAGTPADDTGIGSVAAPESWYPRSLGSPDASGGQDAMRYAWFGRARRLAIDDGHGVRIHDTGDHRIGGVSQQQGAGGTITFVSQHGPVEVDRLPLVGAEPAGSTPTGPAGDPFAALEKLADLHARGVIDDADFAAKKAELLARI